VPISVCIFSAVDHVSIPMNIRQLLLLAATLLLTISLGLNGCRNPVDLSGLDQLAKTDIDMVADVSLREMERLLDDLLVKLYKRNPRELTKVPGMTIDQRRDQIFGRPGRLVFNELERMQGTDALNLAFNPSYHGDRVFALMVGLAGVVRSAYNWLDQQFMFDSLDQQALFNSARNIEVLAWRLSNSRGLDGELLLLSNSRPGEKENLSYERLFGKMIAIQDMMAFIIAGKWDRGFNQTVFGAARLMFIPMGM
jgi:hypothetical protein